MGEITHSDNRYIELRYTAAAIGNGAFGLRISHPDAQGHIWIQYWVEGLPQDLSLDSFGLRFEQIENLRQYLRNLHLEY
jgi:hypothetical protein